MICKHILLITFLNKPEYIFCTSFIGFKYFYLLLMICLHIVKWFQALFYNSHNYTSVICLHTVKWSNSSIFNNQI